MIKETKYVTISLKPDLDHLAQEAVRGDFKAITDCDRSFIQPFIEELITQKDKRTVFGIPTLSKDLIGVENFKKGVDILCTGIYTRNPSPPQMALEIIRNFLSKCRNSLGPSYCKIYFDMGPLDNVKTHTLYILKYFKADSMSLTSPYKFLYNFFK